MDVLHECGCLSEKLQHSKINFFSWRPVSKNNRMGNISTEVMKLSDTINCFTVNASWKTRIHSAHVSVLCDSVSWFNSYGISQERRKFLHLEQNKQHVSLIKLKHSSLEWLHNVISSRQQLSVTLIISLQLF